MTVLKITVSVIALLVTAIAYTLVFASITLRVHGARALGWVTLKNDPVFWILLGLVAASETWLGIRWLRR